MKTYAGVDPHDVDDIRAIVAGLHRKLNLLRGSKTRAESRCCPEYSETVRQLHEFNQQLSDKRKLLRSVREQAEEMPAN